MSAPLLVLPGPLPGQIYDDLVELEALAITADEAVTALPSPSHRQDLQTVRSCETFTTLGL